MVKSSNAEKVEIEEGMTMELVTEIEMMQAELAMAWDGRVAPLPVKPEGELPIFCRR